MNLLSVKLLTSATEIRMKQSVAQFLQNLPQYVLQTRCPICSKRHLYPWTKVEKSMLSTEGERQSGSRTEHRHRIFPKNKSLCCHKVLFMHRIRNPTCIFFRILIQDLCRLSPLVDWVSAHLVRVQPVKLLVDFLSEKNDENKHLRKLTL